MPQEEKLYVSVSLAMNYYSVKVTVKSSLEGQWQAALMSMRYPFLEKDSGGTAEEPLPPLGS
jgi:hypothetical protein